jgi:hypothetical protein
MLADELHSMIHVPGLNDENAAELFFGFGIGAVGRCHLAATVIRDGGTMSATDAFIDVTAESGGTEVPRWRTSSSRFVLPVTARCERRHSEMVTRADSY